MSPLLIAVLAAAAAALGWALRPHRHEDSGATRAMAVDQGLLAARRVRLRDESVRLEAELDLQRGVFEVSSELVGCIDETDLHARLSSALSRYWTGGQLELLVWERGAWRGLGGGHCGAPPDLGAPVQLPGEGGDLVLDLSPGVDGQAALVLRQARAQPSLSGASPVQRRGVAELLRGQFALSLRRVMLFRSLQELARTDPLTGTWRRWYGEARLAELADGGAVVSVGVVDIDLFKRINDGFGHAAGDRVLAAVGRCLASHLRSEDLVARIGGEEFLLLLPGTPPPAALLVAERLRSAVAALPDLPAKITVSIGVASCHRDETAGQLLARADDALYRAKHEGRDRTVLAEGPDDAALVRTEAVRREPGQGSSGSRETATSASSGTIRIRRG